MEKVSIGVRLSQENNDFLTIYKDHLNENPRTAHSGRMTKEGVLDWIISEARIKFEKKQKQEADNA